MAENERDYYATYRFYDERGRRLAIFSTPYSEGKLHVWVITCSDKEKDFSKRRARLIFEGRRDKVVNTRGQEFILDIDKDKPKWAFIQWCKEHYFKMRTVTIIEEKDVLMRGQEFLKNEYSLLTTEEVEKVKTEI